MSASASVRRQRTGMWVALWVLTGCGLLVSMLAWQRSRTEDTAAAAGTAVVPARPAPRVVFSTASVTQGAPAHNAVAATVPAAAAVGIYRHPSGAFSLAYPVEWELDESETAAFFYAPDDSALMFVTFSALPVEKPDDLPALAAEATIDLWGQEPRFALGGQLPQEDGSQLAVFSYALEDRHPMTGLAFYVQQFDLFFSQTVVVAVERYDAYRTLLDQMINSFEYDVGAARSVLTGSDALP